MSNKWQKQGLNLGLSDSKTCAHSTIPLYENSCYHKALLIILKIEMRSNVDIDSRGLPFIKDKRSTQIMVNSRQNVLFATRNVSR